MICGGTPTAASVTILARGLIPNSLAFSADISTTAAAASLRPQELPAVTDPPFLNTGFKLASFSSVEALGPSSVSKITVPFRVLISIGRISSLKTPEAKDL